MGNGDFRVATVRASKGNGVRFRHCNLQLVVRCGRFMFFLDGLHAQMQILKCAVDVVVDAVILASVLVVLDFLVAVGTDLHFKTPFEVRSSKVYAYVKKHVHSDRIKC